MLREAPLKRALKLCTPVPFVGSYYRAVDSEIYRDFYDLKHPKRPLYGLGASAMGGRFTPRGGPSSLYVADDMETALREYTGIPQGGPIRPDPVKGAVSIYPVEVDLAEVLDLRLQVVLDCLETNQSEIVGPWRFRMDGSSPPTWDLGQAVSDQGMQGIVFSSFPGPESCLVVFLDNLKAPSWVEVKNHLGVVLQRLP